MQILSLQCDLITNPLVNNLHFTIYRNYVVVVKVITADPDILNIYVLRHLQTPQITDSIYSIEFLPWGSVKYHEKLLIDPLRPL